MFVVYDMGITPISIGQTFWKVNDGQYHVIRFRRDEHKAALQVDDTPWQTNDPTRELHQGLLCLWHRIYTETT